MPRRALPSLLLLLPVLSGCAGNPDLAACGHSVWVPVRAIDEGWRFDVKELRGDPLPLDALRYRFTNRTAQGEVVEVFEGSVGELADSQGNQTLRFLDDRGDRLLQVGDAFVARVNQSLVLQLSRQGSIVGTSVGCVT